MKELRANIFAESLLPLSNERLLNIYEGAMTVWGEKHNITALMDAAVIRAEILRRLENE